MPLIKLTTCINAPVEVCFNLSRDINLHQQSMQHTNERAISGVTSGLIDLNESVTWRARHFGLTMYMTVKVTELKYPCYFTDQMSKGPFKFMRHYHRFESKGAQTIMTDEFVFKSPLGLIGKLVDSFILKKYMRRLLEKRNNLIKQTAEITCHHEYHTK